MDYNRTFGKYVLLERITIKILISVALLECTTQIKSDHVLLLNILDRILFKDY